MQRRKSSPSLNVDPITAIIQQLNHDWLLGIPLSLPSEGRVSHQHAGVSEIQLVTSRCLQVLSWFSTQSKAPNFQKILIDFEEVAKPLVSEWVPKPSQQHGSLASLPRTKSLLSRELSVQRKEKKARLKLPEHRALLLNKLFEVLSEHQNLSSSSADYELQSPPKATIKPRMAFNAGALSRKSSKSFLSNKRSSSAVASGDVTTSKQPKISDLFGPRLTSTTAVNELTAPNLVSFNSATSLEQPRVFTPPLRDSTSSNETSLLSVNDEQELFPTHDVDAFEAGQAFRTSFLEIDAAASPPDDLCSTLQIHGPFSQPCRMPRNIPFRVRYEMHRIAGALNLYPSDSWKSMVKMCKTETPNWESLCQAVRETAREVNTPAPLPSSSLAWAAASGSFQDSQGQTVILSGSLTWADAKKKNIFEFQLKPLRLEKSCRLHRRFGADRFLVVSMPYFTRLPTHLRNKSKSDGVSYSKQISNWLAQSTHRICGREWRSFFLEADKKKSKDHQKGLKVYLFAVDGIDFGLPGPVIGAFPDTEWRYGRKHSPMPVRQLLQWHLHPSEHLRSTDLKLFSRFSLGLSKTLPTVVLRPEQFVILQSPPGKPVMNDGCAMMSLDMAKEVARQLGLTELPTAFQARIGGAKGLWTVDYHNSHPKSGHNNLWIEISDSQLKIHPHPLHCADADDEQRCFEVLKYSKPATSSQLNAQYINILDQHRIEKGMLDVALRNDIKDYTESFKLAAKDSRTLLSWLYQYHRPGRGNDPPKSAGAFPRSTEEQAVMLLESGFRVADCALLAEKFNLMLTNTLDNYMERLHIKVAMSTSVFCVADPYGVLEPREVYIGLTGRYENPVTHVPENGIFGVDVLVARNPAHLPSDMQKVKAVFHEKLRNFKDVIVFSTKGDQPLASLLSGGDYDGDTVFVCWDQSFVQKFENESLPHNLPTPAECGIEQRSQQLAQVFLQSAGTMSGTEYHAECDLFLTQCFWFNCQAPLLGQCVLEHEKFIYHRGRMSSTAAMKLATLAGYLVDANKQGYFLSESAWSRVRKEVSGEKALPEPAYRTGDAPAMRRNTYYHGYNNVIDWLKFDVAASRKTEVLTELGKDRNRDSDAQLKVFWKKAWVQAGEEARSAKSDNDKGSKALQAILNDLKLRVHDLSRQWSTKTAGMKSFAAVGATNNIDSDKFQQAVEHLHSVFLAMAPLPSVKHPLIEQWKQEQDQEHSYWQTLKASCLYTHYSLGKIAWYLAGKSLCKIKADATCNTRVLTSEMYSLLKPDRRLVERMTVPAMNFDADDARDDEYSVEEDGGNIMESWVY